MVTNIMVHFAFYSYYKKPIKQTILLNLKKQSLLQKIRKQEPYSEMRWLIYTQYQIQIFIAFDKDDQLYYATCLSWSVKVLLLKFFLKIML